MAYQKNVDDMRATPALKLIELMEVRGIRVDSSHPYIPVVPATREHPGITGRRSIPWETGRLAEYDAVLIATDHDGVDYAGLVRHARLVIDTRNACARHGITAENIVKA